MNEKMTITKKHAARFLELCDAGLVKGLGVQEPGRMCIEACWNAALGLPHGDNPPCVGAAVRAAKIALNDSDWSSDQARARGMRAIGIAQAGSDQIDQVEFVRLLQVGYAAFQQKHPPRDDAKAAHCTARAARYIAQAAENTAWAAECTAEAARYTAWAAECTDEALSAFALVILDALKALKSPGCEFLDLIEE